MGCPGIWGPWQWNTLALGALAVGYDGSGVPWQWDTMAAGIVEALNPQGKMLFTRV